MVNLFSPGDTVLMIETGYFSEGWAEMAARHGIEIRTVGADWRHGVDIAAIERALVEDAGHVIKAVCAVHNETATGLLLPLPEVRAAMDAAKHPALLLSDTISSLGSMDFRMDEWGVDAVVGGSQKGLMLPVGFSFTGVSAKGMEAHKTAKLSRALFRLDLDAEPSSEEPLSAPCRSTCSTAFASRCILSRTKAWTPCSPGMRVSARRCGARCVRGPAMTGHSCSAPIRRGIRIR